MADPSHSKHVTETRDTIQNESWHEIYTWTLSPTIALSWLVTWSESWSVLAHSLLVLVSFAAARARVTQCSPPSGVDVYLKSGCQKKTGQSVKNVNGRGSTEWVHTSIIDRSGGVLDKYTKHRFLTALVLEIRLSLYSTPSDAIFISKLSPFSETHRTRKF